jgi:peptidoglycan/LPS O-acetylase OafA/YrhL
MEISATAPQTTGRLLLIDALRGIAAFAVFIFHLFISDALNVATIPQSDLTTSRVLYFIPGFGYAGIYLFFVISGFCIHLRWAKQKAKGIENPKIDIIAFWRRRWIRLYPAYIAAIVLFLVWQYKTGTFNTGGIFVWDMISHLLMIHNLDNRVVYSMNGVFWTLAIEEQLYLIYFLLLWIRKRFGWTTALIVCFAARFGWLAFILIGNKFFPFEIPFTESALANWWIWALGAAAVENYYRVIHFPRWCYSLKLAVLFTLSAATVHYLGAGGIAQKIAWLTEPCLWGAGFFCLVNRVMEHEVTITPIVRRIAVICAGVGLFSYSLYLTHEVVLSAMAGYGALAVTSAALLFAYVFYLIFEKPFVKYLAAQKN